MDWMPLGDYETFRHWSGKPRAWGPQESGWRAWFGGKIVDGLCEVLDEHLAVRRRGVPAAIGCVPWLSSEAVAETLLALSAFCVVCRLALLRQEGVDHARTEVGRLGDIDGDRSNRGPHRK